MFGRWNTQLHEELSNEITIGITIAFMLRTVLSPQQSEGEEEVVVINDNNILLNKKAYPVLNEQALCL